MWLRVLTLVCIGLILTLSSTLPVYAAGAVGDGSPESCTEAALNTVLAQVMATGGTVTFNCGENPHSITVTSPKLITSPITIDGGGLITLSGGGTTTILELQDDMPLLTLKDLTIANGYATPASPAGVCRNDACGGGVRGHYRASLTVINCKFLNNQAVASTLTSRNNLDYGGGAIYLHSGRLTVSNSEFTSNSVQNGAGGAIHTLHSNVTISNSTFNNNQSNYYGGAIYTDGTINDAAGITSNGQVYLTHNVFINNQGNGQGGAIFNYLYVNFQPNVLVVYDTNRFDNNRVGMDFENFAYGGALRIGNGPARILNTTFSGNTAQREGGAIYSGELAQVYIWNSTFYGNQAPGINANDGFGGAIKIANTAGFNLINTTIVNNIAGQMGGGIFTTQSGVVLNNSIVANNTASNPWNTGQNCDRTYRGSNNLQSPRLDNSDPPCASGVKYGDPVLGPLADNGGFTQTMALLAGSPAIDAGNNSYCLETDQRGTFRTFDGNYDGKGECDIGAYEYASFDNAAAANAPPYRKFFPTMSVTLNWVGVDWATGYEVEIDNNADFLSVNYRSTGLDAHDLSYSTSVSQEGLYFWRVRAKRDDGTPGAWSTADSFLVRLL
jgi:predicted outer membrane repeat protein